MPALQTTLALFRITTPEKTLRVLVSWIYLYLVKNFIDVTADGYSSLKEPVDILLQRYAIVLGCRVPDAAI